MEVNQSLQMSSKLIHFYRISIKIAYYVLSFNTSNLDGDPYLNCLIAASTEFVAYIFVWFTTRYAPRRFTLPFTLLLGGVLLLLIELVPQGLYNVVRLESCTLWNTGQNITVLCCAKM